ncbi:MAG: hypothetical protein KBT40_04340 [bacterium]|nr:hypothetical protein [Candidatus Minthenecus merdequi]
MKKLIIHPKDSSTDFLKSIYKGLDEVELYTRHLTSKKVNRLFHHCPETSQIILLGHGVEKGLLCHVQKDNECYDTIIVGHPHVYFLRNHHNTVGIFCNADKFAHAEGLHGLFTGMIISELQEAEMFEIKTSKEEIDTENVKLALRVRQLLDEGCPLREFPKRMSELDDIHSELTEFNYSHFYYF